MSITVSFAVSIFLLGAAVGALLTRLQWIAFKQKVSQEMMEQLGAKARRKRNKILPSERSKIHSAARG